MSAKSKVVTAKQRAVDEEPFDVSLQQLLAGMAYVDLRVRWAVARARIQGLDPDDEFRGLYISENQIDNLLGYELGNNLWPGKNGQTDELEGWGQILADARAQWLDQLNVSFEERRRLLISRLIDNFGLTAAELDVLLVTLAPEVDPRYERLFSYLQDDVTKKRPSVDLVLNLLTDSFREKLRLRKLVCEDGRLLRSRLLVRFSDGSSREPTLLSQYVRPAARVVEHLLGNSGVDDQLDGCVTLLDASDPAPWLPEELVQKILSSFKEESSPDYPLGWPIFAFRGSYGVGKRAAAQHLAGHLGRPLLLVNLEQLAKSEIGLAEGMLLAFRDARLMDAVLYLGQWDAILEDDKPPEDILQQTLDFPGLVIMAGEGQWQPLGRHIERRILRVSFPAGDYSQRLRIWRHYLDEADLPVEHIANTFIFSPGQIKDVVATARDLARWRQGALSAQDLLLASRSHSNQKLTALATKIVPRYKWDDIVLPADTMAQLREMTNTVRHRPQVYNKWGFGRKLALGKGLSALFAGESGTGKTMAADIMAGELGQDLYKIDLSMLVSKYIGETEKNLNKVFTEAETSNAILFFDEADAIFGKRSEVKDSHDRYANIEISYLLQRMETYDGVVILASNLRGNLDEAFTRRLHFIVEFPFPEAPDREVIWQVNFPSETPVEDDVDYKLLARRFRIAGGNIRNIIMAAAFLAAEEGSEVAMRHLLHGTRREYQKIGKLIDEELFALDDDE